MLIFDNILFATFIPQILMFLGFISCVTVPLFSSFGDSQSVFTTETTSTDTLVESSVESPTAHFFDYQDFQKSISAPDLSGIGLFKDTREFVYPLVTHFRILSRVHFAHFTRPPPFSYNFV